MAKFDAGLAVEKLEYDFTAYGGGAGDITEPSTGAVNRFFKQMKRMVKDVKALQSLAEQVELEEMTDEDVVNAIDNMDEAEAGTSAMQAAMIKNLAELCGGVREEHKVEDGDGLVIRTDEVVVGGSPSFDDLNGLPYRVLQAFSTWLMAEIQPKRTTPGTNN